MGPNELLDKGFYVGSPIPRFHVVRQSDVEECELLDTAGGDWLGIAQEGVDELDQDRRRVVRVRPMGISRGVAGATFDTFDGATRTRLAADGDGRLVPATADDHVVGIALTSAAAVGDWVDVQLTPGVQVPSA